MNTATLQEKIQQLPPDVQQTIEDLVDKLLNTSKPKKKMKFEWEVALKHLHNHYTSVELQHEILNDWIKQP